MILVADWRAKAVFHRGAVNTGANASVTLVNAICKGATVAVVVETLIVITSVDRSTLAIDHMITSVTLAVAPLALVNALGVWPTATIVDHALVEVTALESIAVKTVVTDALKALAGVTTCRVNIAIVSARCTLVWTAELIVGHG